MQEQLPNGHHKGFNGFYKLQEIKTNAATASSVSYENIKKNIKLGLPKVEDLPEFKKVKGHDTPIAIVGGGPSLKKYIHELKDFRTIFVAGSSHDYIREQGFVPTYAAICDPDPISINYFKQLHSETKYLLSTAVDNKVIEHFNQYQRILWHCHSNDYDVKEISELEGREYNAIAGGCTVGLRSVNIAIMMGYTNLHLFGFDSCMSEEEHHAYMISDKEKTDLGVIYRLKIGDSSSGKGPDDKVYYCVGYQMAQADNFKNLYVNFGKLFTPTFHGEGLLPDYWKLMIKLLTEPEAKGAETENLGKFLEKPQ